MNLSQLLIRLKRVAVLGFGLASGLGLQAQTWSPAAPMPVPRSGFQAVLLKTGKVLAIGGKNVCALLNRADLYDPATGAWTPAGCMSAQRGPGFTAVLMQDGRVLVSGGTDFATGDPILAVDVYDPVSNSWSLAAPMTRPDWNHASCLMQDGKVFIAGGELGNGACATTGSTQTYDPAADLWWGHCGMTTPREACLMTPLPDGRVLVMSGDQYCQGTSMASAEVYQPATTNWAPVASMASGHRAGTCSLLADGTVLVTGGILDVDPDLTAGTETYDPAADAWSPAGCLSAPKHGHCATVLANGQVLVTGGTGPCEAHDGTACDLFDPATRTWMPTVPLLTGRNAHQAVLLPDGSVLVAGGLDPSGNTLDAVEIFHPNRPPCLDPIGDQTVLEGQTLSFVVTGHDPDPCQHLTYSISNRASCSGFDPDTHTFTWTPGFDRAGVYPNVLFTVTDNGTPPLQASQAISITVGKVNQPPVLDNLGCNYTILEGQELDLTVTGSDPDGDPLVFSASNLPPGATFNPVTQVFSWTPDYTQAGCYPNVQFTVTDNGVPPLQAAGTIRITVGNVNRPPVMGPIGNLTVLEGQTLSFTVTATDPDGDCLAYSASNLPCGATFDPLCHVFTWTPDYSQAGNYPCVTFTVADSGTPMQQATQVVTITVGNVNRAPVFTPLGTQQGLLDQALVFGVQATDPDGDAVVLSASQLPPGATFDPGCRRFTWTPDYTQAGNYTVVFTATDNGTPSLSSQMQVALAIAVPPPTGLTVDLINSVTQLKLPKAMENSYLANLRNVADFVEKGRVLLAAVELVVFMAKVDVDVLRNKLDAGTGRNLDAGATDLLGKLWPGLK